MLDFDFSKILIVAIIALVVIGPERLPRFARTLGTLLGRARGYINDVKNEVNRTIEIEELHKIRQQTQESISTFKSNLNDHIQEVSSTVQEGLATAQTDFMAGDSHDDDGPVVHHPHMSRRPRHPVYHHPGKNWRIKQNNTPKWYKSKTHTRTQLQSHAARNSRRKTESY